MCSNQISEFEGRGSGTGQKKPAQQKLKQETCLALAIFLTRPQADLQIGANWKITPVTASVKTNLAEGSPTLDRASKKMSWGWKMYGSQMIEYCGGRLTAKIGAIPKGEIGRAHV
jgi:hypothetical protein